MTPSTLLVADPKLMEEVKVKTFSGAAVSIVAAIMIAVLFFSELSIYMTPERVDRLVVDKTRGEKLMVSFDITFPRLPCSLLTMTALDVAGESHLDLEQDIRKRVVTPSGEVLPQELKYDLSGAAKDAARITVRYVLILYALCNRLLLVCFYSVLCLLVSIHLSSALTIHPVHIHILLVPTLPPVSATATAASAVLDATTVVAVFSSF